MSTLTIELPAQEAQTGFNLRRWAEVLKDPELAKFEGRVETDRHGHVLMSPPPALSHSGFQSEIVYLLRTLLRDGRPFTECPISTADGVRAADVAWASKERIQQNRKKVCFARAPEICVEILSPGNSDAEIKEKMALYFDAGAEEVWTCDGVGRMKFFERGGQRLGGGSVLCPKFPKQLDTGEML